MEVALWHYETIAHISFDGYVLILVLVEVALWQMWKKTGTVFVSHCLNPCSSGSGALTFLNQTQTTIGQGVLILVLVEVALWLKQNANIQAWTSCLNPCSSGSGALTYGGVIKEQLAKRVLILVLVEVALWQCYMLMLNTHDNVLILVLVEVALWREQVWYVF